MNQPSKRARVGRRRRTTLDAAPEACEKGRVECPCPMAACEPSGKCVTGLYFDPHVRRFRVTDGRCPATYRYFDTIQACFQEGGAYCGKPRCARKPSLPCPEPRTCDDLLRSVLEAQRALTRILNGEADKLECAVACVDNFDALIWLSQSVNRTLTDVAFLEQALYHELEQILDLCEPCLCRSAPCQACEPCAATRPESDGSVCEDPKSPAASAGGEDA